MLCFCVFLLIEMVNVSFGRLPHKVIKSTREEHPTLLKFLSSFADSVFCMLCLCDILSQQKVFYFETLALFRLSECVTLQAVNMTTLSRLLVVPQSLI